MKAKRALCMLAAILLVVAMMLIFLTGCNRQVIDTTFSYDNAILALPDGSVISGKIESWKDYDDGDQIQVKIDGTTYLVLASLPVVILERDGTVLLLSLFFGVPMFFAKENWIMGGPVHESKESRKKSVRSRNVRCREKGYGHGDTATARRVRSKAYPRDRRSGSVGAA